jgi:hypothetical protein
MDSLTGFAGLVKGFFEIFAALFAAQPPQTNIAP